MKLPATNARAWRILRNAAYIVLLAVAVGLVVRWWPHLAAIWRNQALTFAVVIVIMLCGTLVQAHNFLSFLETPAARPRIRRFAPVWSLGALANYIAPLQAGGIAVRVAWLAKRGIGVTDSLLATWRQLIVSVWISLIGLAVGLMLTGDPRGRWPALALFLLWLAVFLLRRAWLALLNRLTGPGWLINRRELLHRAATSITRRGIAGVVVQYLLGALAQYWVYSRFGAPIGAGQAIILVCVIYVSSIVSVLPGNLGITEGIYMLGGYDLGLSIAAMGALALLFRVAHIASNALLASYGIVAARVGRSAAAGAGK